MSLKENVTYQSPNIQIPTVKPAVVNPVPTPSPVTGPDQFQGLVKALQPATNLPTPTPNVPISTPEAPVTPEPVPSMNIIQDLTNRLQSLYKQYSSPF